MFFTSDLLVVCCITENTIFNHIFYKFSNNAEHVSGMQSHSTIWSWTFVDIYTARLENLSDDVIAVA